MALLFKSCLFLLGVIVLSTYADAYWGDATWYDVGLGACGWWNGNGELVAAVSQTEYGWQANPNNAPVCGRCATLWYGSKSVKVKIVDKCMGCASGSIDLSPTAFERLAPRSAGRIKVSWEYSGC